MKTPAHDSRLEAEAPGRREQLGLGPPGPSSSSFQGAGWGPGVCPWPPPLQARGKAELTSGPGAQAGRRIIKMPEVRR